jgi:DsbE subfamily thiol:disulfide oxidoreductase
MKTKTMFAIILSLLCVAAFMAFRFGLLSNTKIAERASNSTVRMNKVSAVRLPSLFEGEDDFVFDKPDHYSAVNFWASWCHPCREEMPWLQELRTRANIRIYGISYVDNRDDARNFLATYGNPFYAVGEDPRGTLAIEWGLTGVPETFFFDDQGNVIYRHIGSIEQEDITFIMDKIMKYQKEKMQEHED